MSLREEDRQKNGCPSRTFGLAAAAIGVGVGAALYYFFSKRPENPSSEGASSENWHCESPQTLENVINNNNSRHQVFRERRWSLEECSICFEVILRDQEVMALPCTHNFHQACILPWLQQQQTCPNCRKNVD